MDELKPCPFCGNVPRKTITSSVTKVMCVNNCPLKNFRMAIHQWNTRATADPRLKKAVKKIMARKKDYVSGNRGDYEEGAILGLNLSVGEILDLFPELEEAKDE